MNGRDALAVERAAASKHGSRWLVLDTVHEHDSGDILFVQAVLAADDPLFAFHDPADYPRLPASLVEAANKRHRKSHRVYERTMRSYEPKYWDALDSQEALALARMAIHKHRPWDGAGVLVAGVGGFVVDGLPPLSGDTHVDWIGEDVAELVRLRREKNYLVADALRREIVLGAGATVFMAKDGVEFLINR